MAKRKSSAKTSGLKKNAQAKLPLETLIGSMISQIKPGGKNETKLLSPHSF